MKFLHYQSKKFLGEKRFVFLEASPQDKGTEKHEADIQAEVGKIENALAQGKSVEDAVKEAKANIAQIAKDAKIKITGDSKEGDEDTGGLLDKIDHAESEALSQIEANKERYVTVVKYVSESITLRSRIEDNNSALLKLKNTPEHLYALIQSMQALQKDQTAMKELDLEGSVVEADKDALVQELKVQLVAMEKRVGELEQALLAQVSAEDETLEKVQDELKDEDTVPRIDDVDALYDFRNELQHTKDYLAANLPKETDIIAEIDAKIAELQPAISEANKRSLAAAPEVAAMNVQLEKLRANLRNAEQNLAKVKANPSSTRDQIRQAEGWLAGAQQTLDKHFDAMTEASQKADESIHREKAGPEVPPDTEV